MLLLFELLTDEADKAVAADDAEEEAGDNEEEEEYVEDIEVTAELLSIVAMEDCCSAFDKAVEIEPFDEVEDDSDSSFWRNFEVLLFASEFFCTFPDRLVADVVFLCVEVRVDAADVGFGVLPAVSKVTFDVVLGLFGCFFLGRYL